MIHYNQQIIKDAIIALETGINGSDKDADENAEKVGSTAAVIIAVRLLMPIIEDYKEWQRENDTEPVVDEPESIKDIESNETIKDSPLRVWLDDRISKSIDKRLGEYSINKDAKHTPIPTKTPTENYYKDSGLMEIALILAPVLEISIQKFLDDASEALCRKHALIWDNLGIVIDTHKRTMAYREEMGLDQNSGLGQGEKDFIYRQEAVYQLSVFAYKVVRDMGKNTSEVSKERS